MQNMNIQIMKQLIEQLHTNMNCLQAASSLVCQKNGKPFGLLCGSNLGLQYSKNEKLLYERLKVAASCPYEIYMERVFGFRVEQKEFNGIDSVHCIMKAIKNDTDVIVGGDAFNCPWNAAYKKEHIPHYFVVAHINGIDLICRDPFIANKDFILNENQLLQFCCHFYLYSNLNSDTLDYYSLYQLIFSERKKSLLDLKNIYDDFINDLQESFEWHSIYNDVAPETNIIIINTKHIARSYYGIAGCFSSFYLKINNSEILNIITVTYELGILWSKINLMFIKMLYLKEIKKNIIDNINKLLIKAYHMDCHLMELTKKEGR